MCLIESKACGEVFSLDAGGYCKTTIFSELHNLAKLAMTHETLNLLALNVRSKVTRVQQAMSLVRWLQEGDSSMPRETDGATASANKEVRKAQEQTQTRKRGSYYHYDDETRAKIAKYEVR